MRSRNSIARQSKATNQRKTPPGNNIRSAQRGLFEPRRTSGRVPQQAERMLFPPQNQRPSQSRVLVTKSTDLPRRSGRVGRPYVLVYLNRFRFRPMQDYKLTVCDCERSCTNVSLIQSRLPPAVPSAEECGTSELSDHRNVPMNPARPLP